jgi:hypothetical protein
LPLPEPFFEGLRRVRVCFGFALLVAIPLNSAYPNRGRQTPLGR